jgi:hypothetical protein
MATFDGVYYIRSALNENKPSLAPGPEFPISPPRPVPVLGVEGNPGFRKVRLRLIAALECVVAEQVESSFVLCPLGRQAPTCTPSFLQTPLLLNFLYR